MSEHIDHVAEAIRLRNQGARADYHEEQLKLFTAAQVHATLALADAQREANEQARIANLIALTHVKAQESDFDEGAMLASEALHALIEYERTLATPFSGPDEVPVIRRNIREGLGL